MEGNTTAPRGYGPYRRYSCATYRKVQGCAFRNQHEADRLEQAVRDDLTRMFEQDEGERRESQTARLRTDLAATEKALAALPARFLRNMALYESGAIASEAQLRLANQTVEQDQTRLTLDRERLQTALEVAEASDHRATVFPVLAHQLQAGWEQMTVSQRKSLLHDLVERVEVLSGSYNPKATLREAIPNLM